jgi:multimeric flavodoxin WrbA
VLKEPPLHSPRSIPAELDELAKTHPMSNPKKNARSVKPRAGMPSTQLSKANFAERYDLQFVDPAFDAVRPELARVAAVAWENYRQGRKSPLTHPAGKGFSNPGYQLSDDWRAASQAIAAAQARHDDPELSRRILVINGSARSDQTCPGEMSKSFRMTQLARAVLEDEFAMAVDLLDLSRITSEYGRNIHPCKACFSTAAALCHWPCSCYPNHAMGQTQDWMNAIYPLWVAAHGVMIVSPVNWYQVSSPVKLMMDRLVCADGGNPDPTLTDGKDAALAKKIELAGWDYPRHLAGRSFSVIVHGDVAGVEGVRRSLSDWLSFMKLIPAGAASAIDRYIGYWEPYATSHEAFDRDRAMQDEVRNAARVLAQAVIQQGSGACPEPDTGLTEPRRK